MFTVPNISAAEYEAGVASRTPPAQVAPAQRPAAAPAPGPAAAPDPGADQVRRLVSALSVAETGNEPDPYIRTRYAPRSGSTAFGPVQITGTLLRDRVKRMPKIFSPEELDYAKRLIAQSDKFATYGKNKSAPGYEARYDYGGRGDAADTDADRNLYQRVAEKLVAQQWNASGKNLSKFIQAWRGVGPEQDPRYFKIVQKEFGEISP